jgi:CheY-like chemotaxis protein
MMGDREKAMQSGCDEYLSKPLDEDLLFAKLARFLGQMGPHEPEEHRMLDSSRILIVDDEPFNVDYLEQELEDLGYATASARNGLEALDKVTAQAPDLILLDVMMPFMDASRCVIF